MPDILRKGMNKMASDNEPERTYTFGDLLQNGGARYYMDNHAKMRLECYAIALQHKVLTIDEVRQLEELPPKKPSPTIAELEEQHRKEKNKS